MKVNCQDIRERRTYAIQLQMFESISVNFVRILTLWQHMFRHENSGQAHTHTAIEVGYSYSASLAQSRNIRQDTVQ